MKKTLIALAAVAVSGAAFAQATISGSMQVGIVDTGAAGDTAQVGHLGNGMNAINIATTEDLGGGLRAGFTSQIRFNAATGDMNSNRGTTVTTAGALFHAANVFVGGSFGTVRLGKIAEAANCSFDPWGCGGGAALAAGVGAATPGNGYTSALIGAGTQAASVSYATPTINGFSAGYQTTLSPAANAQASSTNSTVVGRTTERSVFNINYSNGPIAAQYLQVDGGPSTGATAADDKSKGTSIGASYNFGVAQVGLVNAVSKDNAGTKVADVTSLSVIVPMGSYTILAGHNSNSVNKHTKTALGVNYAMSKRTTVGADIFKAEGIAAVPGTGASGASTNGYAIRVRHAF
jgi:hypothetical protein